MKRKKINPQKSIDVIEIANLATQALDTYGERKDIMELQVEYFKESMISFNELKDSMNQLPNEPLVFKELKDACLRMIELSLDNAKRSIQMTALSLEESKANKLFCEVLIKNIGEQNAA